MPPPELDREFLWHLLEHLPAMVWMTDADQSCIYANRSTLAFTGLSLSQMLGSGWRDTVHPDDLVPLELNFERHREDGSALGAEVRNRRHDGEYRWMQVRSQPLFHKDGTFRGTIGLSLDITEAKRHESEPARMVTHDLPSAPPFAFLDRDRHGDAKNRFDLETDLRRAIPAGELLLHFQPKVSLPDYRLVGFEALVRWHHPERGMLPPVTFITLAEECGLIGPLTRWVFEAVGRQQREWIEAGLAPVPIAVNVAPREFLGDLLDDHLAAYQQFELPERLMEIEITESTMITNFDRVCRIVQGLADAGIKVAMDDFGTGYSSLASLNRLPVSTLKIDRAFTKDVDWDRASRAVAAAIISLAAELGLDVVAEGVETREQLNVLRALKCTVVQGFLTGRPVPADEAAELLHHPAPIPTARGLI